MEFSITGLNKMEIEEKLKNIDIIFVCGGNVFYLLDQAIKTGFDQILSEKAQKDLIYIGSSAGSMVVGEKVELASTLDDRAKAPDLKSDGIGLINLAIMPHWGSPIFKEEYFSGFDSIYEANAKVILLNDNQYLFVQDEDCKIVQI
jgi:dipeptidase E